MPLDWSEEAHHLLPASKEEAGAEMHNKFGERHNNIRLQLFTISSTATRWKQLIVSYFDYTTDEVRVLYEHKSSYTMPIQYN